MPLFCSIATVISAEMPYIAMFCSIAAVPSARMSNFTIVLSYIAAVSSARPVPATVHLPAGLSVTHGRLPGCPPVRHEAYLGSESPLSRQVLVVKIVWMISFRSRSQLSNLLKHFKDFSSFIRNELLSGQILNFSKFWKFESYFKFYSNRLMVSHWLLRRVYVMYEWIKFCEIKVKSSKSHNI